MIRNYEIDDYFGLTGEFCRSGSEAVVRIDNGSLCERLSGKSTRVACPTTRFDDYTGPLCKSGFLCPYDSDAIGWHYEDYKKDGPSFFLESDSWTVACYAQGRPHGLRLRWYRNAFDAQLFQHGLQIAYLQFDVPLDHVALELKFFQLRERALQQRRNAIKLIKLFGSDTADDKWLHLSRTLRSEAFMQELMRVADKHSSRFEAQFGFELGRGLAAEALITKYLDQVLEKWHVTHSLSYEDFAFDVRRILLENFPRWLLENGGLLGIQSNRSEHKPSPQLAIVSSDPVERCKSTLKILLENAGVDPGHGFVHMLRVLKHVDKAIDMLRVFKHVDKAIESNRIRQKLSATEVPNADDALAIRLAALLHDADDHKFFPESRDFANARQIMNDADVSSEIQEKAVRMIALVSCSSNGTSVPADLPEWYLYPRYADRLEALGNIGIYRCYTYSRHVGRPDFLDSTPKPTTLAELREAASRERFENYVLKKSNVGESSFMDHFFDKLLHIGKFPCDNAYFSEKAERRLATMQAFVLDFGRLQRVPDRIEYIVQKYKEM